MNEEHQSRWLSRHYIEERVAEIRCRLLMGGEYTCQGSGFLGTCLEEELLDELAELELALLAVEPYVPDRYRLREG